MPSGKLRHSFAAACKLQAPRDLHALDPIRLCLTRSFVRCEGSASTISSAISDKPAARFQEPTAGTAGSVTVSLTRVSLFPPKSGCAAPIRPCSLRCIREDHRLCTCLSIVLLAQSISALHLSVS